MVWGGFLRLQFGLARVPLLDPTAGGHDCGVRANVLQMQTPDNAWFAEQGISGNYHGGATVVYEQTDILEWVLSHSKEDA